VSEDHARVFISCGLREGGEREVAEHVRAMLAEENFEPRLATHDHTLRSIRENIFQRLSKTEYFLFIDFRREKIEDNPGAYRGSLFSHQELAIASFLELNEDILAFQEKGVNRDGILGETQVNAASFSERAELPEKIKQQVQEAWRNDWRRQLVLEQADDPPCELVPQFSGTTGSFFHLKVRNRHIRAAARNCYGYLRSVRDVVSNKTSPFEAAELRWAGYCFPNAIISPRECYRKLDAVWFDSGDPLRPRFNMFSDWPRCLPNLCGPGLWELEYEVISENVPGSRLRLSMEVRNNGEVCLSPAPTERDKALSFS
jgi:hypothetical protein